MREVKGQIFRQGTAYERLEEGFRGKNRWGEIAFLLKHGATNRKARENLIVVGSPPPNRVPGWIGPGVFHFWTCCRWHWVQGYDLALNEHKAANMALAAFYNRKPKTKGSRNPSIPANFRCSR